MPQLHQCGPAIRPVLLPEGAVGFEAARVLLGLMDDIAAVPQRDGGAALDALGVGVKPDAEQRVAFGRERAQTFEVAQASSNPSVPRLRGLLNARASSGRGRRADSIH